jgi:hypothetical protein
MHRVILAAVLSRWFQGRHTRFSRSRELEHARANARAGGPVSERDAELLERYGCLSGTRSAFCQGLSHRGHRHRAHRRAYRHRW